MSARYSTSPALRLQIGDSRLRRWSSGLLLACLALALGLLVRQGYPVTASVLALWILGLLPLLWRDPARGMQLRLWRGQWMLGRGGPPAPVDLLPATTCLPWGVYLSWRASGDGRRAGCWLFADSLSVDDLRRLRAAILLRR